jgi:PadR family transcriptional regulator AphA
MLKQEENMIGEIIETSESKYVRCAESSKAITSRRDIVDLLAYCGEAGSNLIMLDEAHLPQAFFELKTGLAGMILQLFATYHVKAAIVADLDNIKSKRFHELVYECNRGNQVNFFHEIPQAEKWLVG